MMRCYSYDFDSDFENIFRRKNSQSERKNDNSPHPNNKALDVEFDADFEGSTTNKKDYELSIPDKFDQTNCPKGRKYERTNMRLTRS